MGILLRPLSQDALERATRGMLTLTTSEYLVLRALLDGQKANGIASLTGLTKLTVQFYLKTIFRKCGCDRLALVRMAPELERNPEVARHLASLAGERSGKSSMRLALGTLQAASESKGTRVNQSSLRRRHRHLRARRPYRSLRAAAE
jgi:DNA-binding CsgD family transcriptional regulator